MSTNHDLELDGAAPPTHRAIIIQHRSRCEAIACASELAGTCCWLLPAVLRAMAAARLRRYGQHLGTTPASASSAVLWAADFSTGDTSETENPFKCSLNFTSQMCRVRWLLYPEKERDAGGTTAGQRWP